MPTGQSCWQSSWSKGASMASESDSTSLSDVSSTESEAGDGESLELGSSDLDGGGRGEEGTEEQAREAENQR